MSVSFRAMRTEPPQPYDDRQYLTDFDGEFFELCYENVLYLGGQEREVPRGTPVWIVLRANGRILLQTADGYHRWADRGFLQGEKKKRVSAPTSAEQG